jgi:small multidrug resistance family-3 protein
MTRYLPGVVMLAAAVLEVSGDAIIRAGLRSHGWLVVALGAVVLAAYGVILNRLPIPFSRLLGPYVALFALASVAFGRFAFREAVPTSTWIGLAVVLLGGAIIQFGGG